MSSYFRTTEFKATVGLHVHRQETIYLTVPVSDGGFRVGGEETFWGDSAGINRGRTRRSEVTNSSPCSIPWEAWVWVKGNSRDRSNPRRHSLLVYRYRALFLSHSQSVKQLHSDLTHYKLGWLLPTKLQPCTDLVMCTAFCLLHQYQYLAKST